MQKLTLSQLYPRKSAGILINMEKQISKICKSISIVTGSITYQEKIVLIKILDKLNKFHNPILSKNTDCSILTDNVYE